MALLRVLLVLLTAAPALLPCGLPSSAPSPSTSTPRPTTSTSSPRPPATSLVRAPTTPTSPKPPPSPFRGLTTSVPQPFRLTPTTTTPLPKRPSPFKPPPTATSPREPPTTTTPSPGTSPSPEQLVARIRALVRALRDADQLLRALQDFRDQQQLADDATLLRVMKEDANRTLAAQLQHAMGAMGLAMGPAGRDEAMAALLGNATKHHLSAKVPYAAYGKKSAKFVQGQIPADSGKPVAAVGKARSGVAAAASPVKPAANRSTTAAPPSRSPSNATASLVFSARAHTVRNGTVITRIKSDPILGEYKVVIRDLTPAASSGIAPPRDTGDALKDNATAVTGSPRPADLPPVAGTAPSSAGERGRYKFQNTLPAPCSTAVAVSTTAPSPATASRRSGKAASIKSVPARLKASRNAGSPAKAKVQPNKAQGKAQGGKGPQRANTTAATTPTTASTTTTPTITKKSFQKKAAVVDKQQVVLSATLRTAHPSEHEQAVMLEHSPLETPILAGIFPRYGPAASLPTVEEPFVPRSGGEAVPANVLLPPLEEASTTSLPPAATSTLTTTPSTSSTTTLSDPQSSSGTVSFGTSSRTTAPGEQRSASAGGPLQTVRLDAPLTPSLLDVPGGLFLGESPWIPIFVPNSVIGKVEEVPRPTSPRTVVELAKLHVVEATPPPPPESSAASPQDRVVLNDVLEWRPSRSWQYAVRQDRADANSLQDLQLDAQQLHQQLQLQPELRLAALGLLPLSVAENVFYRLQHSGLHDGGAGPYEGIPGVPGTDYPAFSGPPATAFTCAHFRRKGYFADPASGCQAFYVCHGDGRGEAMLCPNGTIFSQEVLVCDWWFNVDCK